jgi:hypothetical protein
MTDQASKTDPASTTGKAGVFVQGVTRVTGSSGSFTIHPEQDRVEERQGGLVRRQLSHDKLCP